MLASGVLAAATFAAVYRWWWRSRQPQDAVLGVARQVENRFPQLHDVLASAVEFLQQSEEDTTAGSAQLRRLVVVEAETAIADLPIEAVIDRRPLHRAALWAAAAVGMLIVCLALDARGVGTAAARLANPFGATAWPREHHLAFRDPPQRLAAGQPFEAVLVDESATLPDEVQVTYRIADHGRRQFIREPMTRVGDTFVARRENVQQSFSLRAEGGDDHTMPWIDVEVVEPPRLDSLAITVHPPSYTGLPPANVARFFEVLAGSRLEVAGAAGDSLSAASIRLSDGGQIAAEIRPDSRGNERHGFYVDPQKWTAATSGQYAIELANSFGVTAAATTGRLRVIPDAPPDIDWRLPKGDLHVIASAVVPIELVVKDNLAIRDVVLTFESDSRSDEIALFNGSRASAAHGGDAQIVRYEWSIASFDLAPRRESRCGPTHTTFAPARDKLRRRDT